MKNERLLHALGQVKEEFIEEAAIKNEKAQKTLKENAKVRKYPRVKWGALAACLCIVAGLSIKTIVFSGKDDVTPQNPQAEGPQNVTNQNTSGNMTTEDNSIEQKDTDTIVSDFTSGITQANTEALPMEPTGRPEENVDYNKGTVIEVGDEGFPNWGLTLSVKNVTSTGLTLLCTQSGGEPTGTLETGEPYRLISLVDGTWKTVEELPLPEGVDGRAWNSLAYLIPMEETREFEINWGWIFGELPPGTYRLIKEFMDFRGTANYDTFDYWVEFEIQ